MGTIIIIIMVKTCKSCFLKGLSEKFFFLLPDLC